MGMELPAVDIFPRDEIPSEKNKIQLRTDTVKQ
jgi:hypothetical protein